MAYLQSATNQGTSSRFQTVTVPAGVTSSHILYLHVGWVISVSAAVTVQTVTSSGAGTGSVVSAYPGTPNVNEGSALCKFTGATAGDVITITCDVAKIWAIALHVFDVDLSTFGTLYTRPASQATNVPAAITTTAGQKVFILSTERTTTVGTTVTVANANGRTVTQDFYSDLAGSSNCSFYLGEFVETGTSSGSTTLTYNNAGTNGMAIHATEVATVTAITASPTAIAPSEAFGTAAVAVAGSVSPVGIASAEAFGVPQAWGTAYPVGIPTGAAVGTPSVTTVAAAVTSITAGAVGTTTAKVRIDATNASSAVVTAATNTGLTTGVVISGTVTLDSDGLGIATLTGLTAGTDYFFGVALNGTAKASRGNFRTATVGAHSYSFAAASCVATGGDPTVMTSIRTRTGPTGRTAEFMAHLGDFHYYSTLTTTAVYLTKYRDCLARSNYGAMMAALPVEYTWSDHELGPDNCDSTTLGSTVIAAVRDVFTRYFPTYDLPATNTDSAPWRSWSRGRIRFIMTDGRTYMSDKNATDNSSKTKLGTAQKAWIKAEVRAAKAAGQGIVWFHEDGGWTSTSTFTNDDTWAAFTTERAELGADFIAAGVAAQMLIIHGDYHAFGADNGSNSAGGIPVICSSPMQQTYYMGASAQYSVGKYPTTSPGTTMYQYGWFDVTDTGGASITVAFTGYSNDNTGGTTADTSRMTYTATLALGTDVAPSGVPSAVGVGTPTLATPITTSPTGIATGYATGTAAATTTVTASPAGIASAEATGVPIASTVASIAPTGLASGEAVGTPAAGLSTPLSPTGIASAAAMGNPTLSLNNASSPTGIGTGEAVGVPVAVTTVSASPVGIASATAVGNPVVNVGLTSTPVGVASTVAFGNPALSQSLQSTPTAIASAEALGAPALSAIVVLSPTGSASGISLGLPTAGVTQYLMALSIDPAYAIGSPAVVLITASASRGATDGTAQFTLGDEGTSARIDSP